MIVNLFLAAKRNDENYLCVRMKIGVQVQLMKNWRSLDVMGLDRLDECGIEFWIERVGVSMRVGWIMRIFAKGTYGL